ncbi:MAG TPA: hypothetical protein VN817_01425 [Solirubrobacteraceae bacterium]|nr:hypothetical protein [Solirubrobacteraceae bacterium]
MSQIVSILILVELDSVGIALAPRLHDSTAAAVAGLVVEPVVLDVVERAAVLEVLAPVELLLELPHPASKTPAASGIDSQVKSVRIV